jgi:hypothetical protein
MKSMIGFIIFVLAVLGLLYSISGKKYSRVPDDAAHKGITDYAVCMGCHGPGKQSPLKADHPPKYECFQCHKTKRIRDMK